MLSKDQAHAVYFDTYFFSYGTYCRVVLISSVRCTAGVARSGCVMLMQMYVNCAHRSSALLTISSPLVTICTTCCNNRKLNSATQYICVVQEVLK